MHLLRSLGSVVERFVHIEEVGGSIPSATTIRNVNIDLWGGGFDLDTKEIDYNSVINLRPNQENPSRDILSKETREKFDNIVNKLLA